MKCKALSIIAAGAILATTLIPFANASAWSANPADSASYTILKEINDASGNVNNTFTYTITADSSNPAAVEGVPATTTIVFNDVTPTGGRATYTGTIDFSSAVFTELGDYGFIVKETATTNPIKYPLSTESYTIWFSVRNVTGSGGVPTGEHAVLAGAATNSNGDKVVDGPDGNMIIFGSGASDRTYIDVKVQTKGNSADPNECFKINVHFDNNDDKVYKVKTDSTCKNNLAMLTADEITGSNIVTVYLKNGDVATIGKDSNNLNQIPIGLRYVVIEEGAADYKTFIDGSTTDNKTSIVKTTVGEDESDFEKSNRTTVLNMKEITPRTGIVSSLLPFAIITIIGIAGAILVIKK
ncbi:hypothetical protein IJM16_01100 [Candidatus Saccharibacteria bacterium]|nr:hypothetical protein [Candidatus Saccharibacteria bacterium]